MKKEVEVIDFEKIKEVEYLDKLLRLSKVNYLQNKYPSLKQETNKFCGNTIKIIDIIEQR